MIYLQSEHKSFAETKLQFSEAYIAHLERMLETYRRKGETRDVGAPIHHRMSPEQMLGLIQAKGRRVDSLLSQPGWEHNGDDLDKIAEECLDQANYALYIASIASLLLKEVEDADS